MLKKKRMDIVATSVALARIESLQAQAFKVSQSEKLIVDKMSKLADAFNLCFKFDGLCGKSIGGLTEEYVNCLITNGLIRKVFAVKDVLIVHRLRKEYKNFEKELKRLSQEHSIIHGKIEVAVKNISLLI